MDFIRKTMWIAIGMLVIFLLFAGNAYAAPSEQWNRTFGGKAEDRANSVIQTTDGGFVITGQFKYLYQDIRLPGNVDAWIIRTDADGNLLWDKTFGEVSDDDKATAVLQTGDGGFVLAGFTLATGYGAGSDTDAWLVKIDGNGSQQWKKTFKGEKDAVANDVRQTPDGGYIIAGKYSYGTDPYGKEISDAFLIRTDGNGSQKWSKTFGEAKEAKSVQLTGDGGYIFAGYSRKSLDFGATQTDGFLLKVDVNGNKQWSKEFGGKKDDALNSVSPTADGGHILVGNTRSYEAAGSDVWLIKVDAGGNEQWIKTFGNTGEDNAYTVLQAPDGEYLLAGKTERYGTGKEDAWVIKTDPRGGQMWSLRIGGTEGDWISSLQQTSDGGYVFAGTTYSYGNGSADAWLIRIPGEKPPVLNATPTQTSTAAPTSIATPVETMMPADIPETSVPPETPGFFGIYAIVILMTMCLVRKNKTDGPYKLK